ncbi:hypothetical protein JRI60_52665 [Archangium violaceum]|uniref:hypothetical protein n=1 Tax=Archangium violaceum TaxID=83451 RepID=UPI00194EF014|nr:hypothetical protein [Archangium violaceum]QRN97488.1 hypothetical protein JRI60_52665 [Archangium violaceum]
MGTYAQMGTWPWGQRALTRIAEQRALCQEMATRPNAAPNAAELAREARGHLDRATQAADQKRPPWGRSGVFIDTVETNLHAAHCLMLRYMPLGDLEARLPELISSIREHLPAQDPRRVAVEELLRAAQASPLLAESKRETVITAVQAALEAREREYLRVRSFRNIVYGVTVCLTLLAVGLGSFMAVNPSVMPICFQPENRIVCPTASQPYAGRVEDPDPMFAELAKRSDYFVIELVGLIAAAVAAAASLRQLRGTAVPYSVPLALALLKLPTGALTAVLGLLLMRGEFIPGLSALDTSAQIISWAVVFGYAQQLFTRLVDERGQALLNAVGGAENATLMDQRMSPTPGMKS